MSGYAIDINGELVEGVVVEKEKARQVFETEARKEVSHKPTASIAEHVVGNVFKTRVFPIPKRGARTIRVTTVEEIDAAGTFYLLLGFGNNKVDNYHFSVQVDSFGKVPPRIWDGHSSTPRTGRNMIALEVSKDSADRTRYRESYSASEPIAPSGLILYLPSSPLVSIVETAESKDDLYFVVGGLFTSAANTASSGSSNSFDKSTERVGIVWDTSLSRKSQSLDTDIQVVKQIATKLGTGAKLDIYPFSNAMGTPVSLVMSGNSSNDWSTIERHLKQLSYDGGTDLSALRLTKGPTFEHSTDTYAYYCLFTDGMHNMSTKALPQTLESPVYIFATSPEANSSLLKILARKSGGEYFKLSTSTPTEEVRRKVEGLGQPSFSFLSVNADAAIVTEVYPSIPTRVESTFRLCGKLSASVLRSGSPTFLTLNFGFGTKITHSQSFQLTTQGAGFTSLVPRMWAQRKIDELALFPEETENEKVILDLGRQFSIVTPSTSIIVLEELEQYVKHDIEPPAALQSIRAKWLAIKQERANEQKSKEEEKIISILSLWNRRTAWWNEDRASSEAEERTHIHYLPYGDGVDLTSRALASQWIDWEALNAPYSSSDSDSTSGEGWDYEEDDLDDDESRASSDISSGSEGTGTGSGSDSGSESDASSDSESDPSSGLITGGLADLRLERSRSNRRSSFTLSSRNDEMKRSEEDDDEDAAGFGLFDDEPIAPPPPPAKSSISSLFQKLSSHVKEKEKDMDTDKREKKDAAPKFKNKKMAKESYFDSADMAPVAKEESKKRFSLGGKGVRSSAAPADDDDIVGGPPPAGKGVTRGLAKGAPPRPAPQGPGAAPTSSSRSSYSSAEGAPMLQMQQQQQPMRQQAFFGLAKPQLGSPAAAASFASAFTTGTTNSINMNSIGSLLQSPSSSISSSAMPRSRTSSISPSAMPPPPPAAPASKSYAMPPPPPPGAMPAPLSMPPPPPSAGFGGPPPPPGFGGPLPPPSFAAPSGYAGPPVNLPMAPSAAGAPSLGRAFSARSSSISSSIAPPPPPISAPAPAPLPAPAPASPAPQSSRSSLLSNIKAGSSLKKTSESVRERAEAPVASQLDMFSTLAASLSRRSTAITGSASEDEEDEDEEEEGAWDDDKLAGDLFGASSSEISIQLDMAPEPQAELLMELNESDFYSKDSYGESETSQDLFGGLLSSLTEKRKSSTPSQQLYNGDSSRSGSSGRGRGAGSASLSSSRGGRIGGRSLDTSDAGEVRSTGSASMDRRSKQTLPDASRDQIMSEPIKPKPLAALPMKFQRPAPITRNTDMKFVPDLDAPSFTPYVAQHVPLEYAYFEAIDPNAPVEYSKDLTPAPEFPPVDWDSIVYGSNPSEQSWKRWRARHKEQSWAEYEQKAFGVGNVFMEHFNQQRRLILESRIQSDIEAVEAENRKNRPLKSTAFEPERFRIALSKTTTASEEPWILELGINNSASTAYTHYLMMRERPELAKLSKFYLDAADYFFESLNDPKKAATILSNLAELELENPQFLRLIAFRLERAPEDPYLQNAINIYRKVLAIRGEEPQSYRDLAMALSRRALFLAKSLVTLQAGAFVMSVGKKTLAESRPSYNRYSLQEEKRIQAEMRSLLEESLKLLNDVVLKKWDVRFAQVEVVALMDINRVVAIIRSLNLEHVIGIHNFVDPRLYAAHMPVDLRIQIQWDTDMTDVELTVVEPSGEKCNSIHNKTASGGMMSRDFTHGYGPVEYLTRYTDAGCYSATLKLFHSLEMKSGTTVLVRTWTDYGRPGLEKEHFFVGRINKAKQTLSVGNIFVSNAKNITKA